MKIRSIAKQFPIDYDFGKRNLVVGGCSFTYNNHESEVSAWPYYLRDLGGFEQVYDCSIPGGGNNHIRNALIYGLEKTPLDPNDSLIIIQWAGNDRDDYIVDPSAINDYPFQYHYEANAWVGMTGGESLVNFRDQQAIARVQHMKTPLCRSIENFITIKSVESYLSANGYQFMFFEYRDYSLPGRDRNFDPRKYLPEPCKSKYHDMMSTPENFYRFCLQRDLLMSDDFHPAADGHLAWTRECLLPFLKTTVI